jgi:hypothetical protein
VHEGVEIYMMGFWDLCGDRFQAGRIPWLNRHLWCAAHGIEGQDEEDFHFLVGKLDMTYLEWVNKKANKKDTRPQAAKEKVKNGKPRSIR